MDEKSKKKLIDLEFIDGLISAIMFRIEGYDGGSASEFSEDALEMLAETGVIKVATNEDGLILTDENNDILTI